MVLLWALSQPSFWIMTVCLLIQAIYLRKESGKMYKTTSSPDILFEFTQAQYSIEESMGPLQAAIRLAAGSGTPLMAFTLTVSTVDGTAVCKLQETGSQELMC